MRINYSPISIIVAVDECGGFGKDGKIPWHFPKDLKHFNNITKDNICVMGRRTYQDLLTYKKSKKFKQVLPDRDTYVITSDSQLECTGATSVQSLRQVLDNIHQDDHRIIFICGGEKLYTQALSWADNIYMTVVPGNYHCDRFFPVDKIANKFKLVEGEEQDQLKFLRYQRSKR